MVSEEQRVRVWEGWLSSEIRELYFAELAHRYQSRQRLIQWCLVVCSSGAVVTLLAKVPGAALWLAASTAGLSAWSLIAQNQKQAIEASDLSSRWHRLALDYETLWHDLSAPDAADRLRRFCERAGEMSKTAHTFPNRVDRLTHWQHHVQRHHGVATAA